MRTNPGGVLKPDEVVGRDAVIEQLWRILQRQSVLLTAERRMGKTSVIRKMAQEQSPKLLKYRDLEGIQTPLEFTERVCNDVHAHLSLQKRTADSFRKMLQDYQGTEIAGFVKFPAASSLSWKRILISSIEALMQVQGEHPVIFFWDELPLMLYNIVKRESESIGMELLDVLRSLRQQHPTLRMVFTGSIGLHNVLRSLKRAGYANSPVNDMYTFELPNLSPKDAMSLASALFKSEHKTPALDSLEALTLSVDHIPFYVHHVVDRCIQQQCSLSKESIEGVIQACIEDINDPWQLRHYLERISTYYSEPEAALIVAILDELCQKDMGVTLQAMQMALERSQLTSAREQLLELLRQLELDHYLERRQNTWRMGNSILSRSWRYQRGF